MTLPPAPSVGLIANPASGTDIRRLVALGIVSGAQDKINLVQRILIGLDAAGVGRVYLMPDLLGIAQAALERLPSWAAALRERAHLLHLEVEHTPEDSLRAAEALRALGVGCIVVLGGDGTVRVVAKGCGLVPLLALSTGTNNVVPSFLEGTLAGLAAGFVARRPDLLAQVAYRSKRLVVSVDGREVDAALVDVGVVRGQAVASRAIWVPEAVRQVVVTRAAPTATGLSSLAGLVSPVTPKEPRGLCLWLGEPRILWVTAPLAPGLVVRMGVEEMRELSLGDSVVVHGGDVLLTLDGEREIALGPGQVAEVRLDDGGPWLVDPEQALGEAVRQRAFVQWASDSDRIRFQHLLTEQEPAKAASNSRRRMQDGPVGSVQGPAPLDRD
ncbi:MAG: NAD(+)/NADH kinase [Anaerolineae bacterium]